MKNPPANIKIASPPVIIHFVYFIYLTYLIITYKHTIVLINFYSSYYSRQHQNDPK